jgi:large subunit ribosomal protein L18
MTKLLEKQVKRIYRHQRLRRKIQGTVERPRLCISRSLNNFSAQVINDLDGKVLLGMSTMSKDIRTKIKDGGNVSAAESLGGIFAAEAIKKGIKKVSFDRGGHAYHGRVKAFAEAARKAGMEF